MTNWPHAPLHQLTEAGAYMVTGSTYLKSHHFRDPLRLDNLHDMLLDLAVEFGWQLEAWSLFSNHYHFVGKSPQDASTLRPFLTKLHRESATWVNKLDNEPGRQVWFNFRDTHLTFQPSYLTRLRYVHTNPVHHRLVQTPSAYRWCSAAWFEREATTSFQRTLETIKIDRLKIYDDFEVTLS